MPNMDASEVDVDEVQIWDLFEAFQKLLAATGKRNRKHEVLYDDTPIALHAADILDALDRSGGSMTFQGLFEGRNKPQLIGLFLALLELIRQKRLRAVQPSAFSPIELQLLDATPIHVNEAEDYSSQLPEEAAADAGAAKPPVLFPTGDIAMTARGGADSDEDELDEEPDGLDDIPEPPDFIDQAVQATNDPETEETP
jgi:hypothetical protein